MKGNLICYSLGKADPTTRSLFKRELNGYLDVSNNGKYKYKREGLLQKIRHKIPIRSVIIVEEKDKNKVTRLLNKYKANYHIFNININPKELTT